MDVKHITASNLLFLADLWEGKLHDFSSHILKPSRAKSYIHSLLCIFTAARINRTWQNASKCV